MSFIWFCNDLLYETSYTSLLTISLSLLLLSLSLPLPTSLLLFPLSLSLSYLLHYTYSRLHTNARTHTHSCYDCTHSCVFLCSTGGQTELVVQLLGAANFLANPGNITVGLATDLAVEVECTSMSDIGSYEWKYRNGTSVSNSLQPFGISQGVGGVLRVYPTSQLMESNKFICCSSDGEALNVTFNLGGCGLRKWGFKGSLIMHTLAHFTR